MEAKTAWLKPPTNSVGLDHLGMQQPPVRIFSSLLPGLTVATDRVAYYSFYPWLVWAFDQAKKGLGLDFVTTLRRAECLLTLVAEHHALILGEHVALHSRGLVGRSTLTPALLDDSVRRIPLADLAALRKENKGSYFQNRYGGLGQYYLGPLRELGVLDREDENVTCSKDVGVPLAEALEARIDRGAFFRILKRGSVERSDLEKLFPFCPCALADHDVEREALVDLLFARKPSREAPKQHRRQTLLLLLDLAAQRGETAEAQLDLAFKAACLTESLDDGTAWEIPDRWLRTRRAWAVYERNDELSVAVFGIFWIVLRLLDAQGGAAGGSLEAGRLVEALARKSLGRTAGAKVPAAVSGKLSRLPDITEWQNPGHEFQRAMDAANATGRGKEDLSGCLVACLDVLLAIAARHTSRQPYVDVAIPPDYLATYPLNLASFQHKLETEWKNLTVAEWLARLATDWGIDAHLRVALRKLRAESIDTFLVFPTDEGIKRKEDPEPPRPGFTASRVDRAVRFLVDLGLLRWDAGQGGDDSGEEVSATPAGWVARITPRGREILESLRG